MDHGAPSIGHLGANLIGDHLETISEVEVVARQHEKLSACLYYCRKAEQVQIFLALFSAGSLGLLINDAEPSFSTPFYRRSYSAGDVLSTIELRSLKKQFRGRLTNESPDHRLY